MHRKGEWLGLYEGWIQRLWTESDGWILGQLLWNFSIELGSKNFKWAIIQLSIVIPPTYVLPQNVPAGAAPGSFCWGAKEPNFVLCYRLHGSTNHLDCLQMQDPSPQISWSTDHLDRLQCMTLPLKFRGSRRDDGSNPIKHIVLEYRCKSSPKVK